MRLLVAEEEDRRLVIRAKHTSLRWRHFATNAIAKQNCSQGSSEIRLDALAHELGVSAERLQPLLDHGYLTITSPHTVIKPEPAALAWLRTMFTPITMRPWLSSDMVATLLCIPLNDLRSLCLMYDVPLQDDPVFGELMSISSFHHFFRSLQRYNDPARFDRQALLLILVEAAKVHGPKNKPLTKLKYGKLLEEEIKRIARLPEPERTFRSTALLDAYQDAKGIADAYSRYKGFVAGEIPKMVRLEKLVEKCVG